MSQVGLTEDQPDVMSRSMKAVIDRGNLSEQDVNVTVLPNEHSDITNIPVNISKLLKKSTTPIHTPNIFTNDTNSLPFIITTIHSTVLGLTSPTASNLDANDGISLSKISAKHTLDFKQRAAFETVCSSFLLSQLKQEETTLQSRVNNLLPQNQNNSQHLHLPVGSSSLKKILKSKGGMSNQLLMYLLGVGGSGKSKVISCVYEFIGNICRYFNWPFNKNTIKICAMSGAAAALLDFGVTLHGEAHLNTCEKILFWPHQVI